MKTYDVCIAGDVSAYADIRIEAENDDEAIRLAKIRAHNPILLDFVPNWDLEMTNIRIVNVVDGDDFVAEDIQLPQNRERVQQAGPSLVEMIKRFMDCAELNQDELEDDTMKLLFEADLLITEIAPEETKTP